MKKTEIVLISLTLLCALPFPTIILVYPLLWLLYHLFPSPRWFWLEMPAFFSARLLSDTARYVTISLLALGLAAGALLWLIARERGLFWRRGRFYLLALLLVAVLAFPLFARYRPAVEVTPQAQLRIVDAPGWVEGAVKWCHAVVEISECQYEPLGWADEQTLVYRKWCGGYYTPAGWQPGEPQPPQAYHLDTGAITPFEGSLEHLSVKPGPRAIAAFEYYPGRYAVTRISPDERWIAFTARHIYGPEDLLIVLNN